MYRKNRLPIVTASVLLCLICMGAKAGAKTYHCLPSKRVGTGQGSPNAKKFKNQNVKCKIKEVIRLRRIPQFLFLTFNFCTLFSGYNVAGNHDNMAPGCFSVFRDSLFGPPSKRLRYR